MDRLDAMAVLRTIVDCGSLSAAGRRLGMPLATVSRKLSDLEAHLNARLVNRSTRGLTLTDAGHEYVAACRRILESVEAAERVAAGEYLAVRGELVVTAPIVFGRLHVVPVVAGFLGLHRDVDVRLVLGDHVVNLLDESIDVALRIGVLPDSGLVSTQVGLVGRVVCASPAYLATAGRPERPEQLVAHHCVTFEGLGAPPEWSFGGGATAMRVRVRARLSVSTADAAIAAAVAGVGITRVLSYQVADALRDGALVRLLPAFEPEPVPVSLVYAGQGRLPMKLRAFLDHAAPRLRERLAAARVAAAGPVAKARSRSRGRPRG